MTKAPVAWHISTYSSEGSGRCVEAGPFTNGIHRFAVRDSQHRGHGHLTFTGTEWAALVAALATVEERSRTTFRAEIGRRAKVGPAPVPRDR